MIRNNSKKTIVLYITVLPLNEKFVFGISKDNENFYHNPPLILNPLTNYEFIIQYALLRSDKQLHKKIDYRFIDLRTIT